MIVSFVCQSGEFSYGEQEKSRTKFFAPRVGQHTLVHHLCSPGAVGEYQLSLVRVLAGFSRAELDAALQE